MEAVGIRELKARLSSYVRRAKAGERIVITERGQEVAELCPVSPERRCVQRMAAEGGLRWSGGKPRGLSGIRVSGKAVSEVVLEERR